MKKSLFIIMAVLIMSALLLSACGGSATPEAASGGTAKDRSVPADYQGKTNPYKGDAAAAEAGKAVYETNCTSCHGATGKGDGPAGASLNPKPGNMAEATAAGEAYVFYRILEGGMKAPYNSAMPAWKGIISDDDSWKVVTYIATLK